MRFGEDNGWLIRFFYYERRISLEVFHALSDGAGTLIFFRTLLAAYLEELGHPVSTGPGLLDRNEPFQNEELEDAYARYAGPQVLRRGRQKTAFSNTNHPERFYTLNVTIGFLSVDELKQVAVNFGASVTEYLAAVLLQTILDNQKALSPGISSR